jgi:hypothetical protein
MEALTMQEQTQKQLSKKEKIEMQMKVNADFWILQSKKLDEVNEAIDRQRRKLGVSIPIESEKVTIRKSQVNV